jgi:hypothetical protein
MSALASLYTRLAAIPRWVMPVICLSAGAVCILTIALGTEKSPFWILIGGANLGFAFADMMNIASRKWETKATAYKTLFAAIKEAQAEVEAKYHEAVSFKNSRDPFSPEAISASRAPAPEKDGGE